MRKNRERNINIATFDGINASLKTGYYHTGIADVVELVPLEYWLDQLALMKQMMADNKAQIYFINPTKFTLPSLTFFSVNEQEGVDLMIYGKNISKFQIICFNEKSITEAFVDFAESIKDSGLVYSLEESVAILEEIISTGSKTEPVG